MSACHQLWAHRAIGRSGNLMFGGFMFLAGMFLLWQGVPGVLTWILLAAAAGIVVLDIGRERLWRNFYQSQEIFRAPITAVVDRDGVSLSEDEAWRWAEFQSHVLTKDFIILLIDNRSFVALPCAAMKAAGNHAAIEEIVKEKVKRMRGRWL